jgi:twitching motility protein PilJ
VKLQENVGLVSKLNLPTTFVMLAAIVFVLAAVPFYQFISAREADVAFAESEQAGLAPARGAIKLIQLVQQHRSLTAGVLAGNAALEEQRTAKQAEVDAAFGELSGAIAPTISDVSESSVGRLKSSWDAAQAAWMHTKAEAGDRKTDPREVAAGHNALVAQLMLVLGSINDQWKMARDPEDATYNLYLASLSQLPALTEPLSRLRDLGATRRGSDALSAADRAVAATLLEQAQSAASGSALSLDKFTELLPETAHKLEAPQKEAVQAAGSLIALARRDLVDSTGAGIDAQDYARQFTAGVEEQYKLIDRTLGVFGEQLDSRVSEQRSSEIVQSALIASIIAFGIVFGFFIVNGIVTPLRHLIRTMLSVQQGDQSRRARLNTLNEFGQLGQQFDKMLDAQVSAQDKARLENQQLNTSIVTLLQGAARLSQRDLTAKVPVAEDVTGAVADALNAMADETAKVLGVVVGVANQVALSAQQVKAQARTVMGVATEEQRSVENAATQLEFASKAMLEIVQLANLCNDAGRRAIATTQKAESTVLGTVEGINSIRETIRETEKRIKRLGERSQEISGVVNLINSIAERTHILALNASMHAASAGEAGRGFAVVANEVQRLAENARDATSKIGALVNNIQVETSDTVVAMNEAITRVVSGSELAERAGAEMRVTRETTSELVELVQRIATDSNSQAKLTQALRVIAGEIEASTKETHDQLESQLGHTDLLVEFSNDLLESVNVFTLPQPMHAPAAVAVSADVTSLERTLRPRGAARG